MTEAQAYVAGWKACTAGCDGRYWFDRPGDDGSNKEISVAWSHGFLDAMEAEEGEEPESACAGY